MNRLPWLKHRANASDDGWLRNVVRQQGLEAGWVWWGLCEQLQVHGNGNMFRRNIIDIANYSCTNPRIILRVLIEMSKKYNGKHHLNWKRIENDLEIEIVNYRKNQEKLQSKTHSKPPENPSKHSPQDKKESRVEKKLPYAITTDRQRLMCAYKVKKGIGAEDRDWDKHNYATWIRACSKLLLAFKARGGVNAAIDFLSVKADEFDKKGLSWTLATIAKHAWDRGKD